MRGLVDVCLKIQHEDIRSTGGSWLTDDYIKGLMYDTVAAGRHFRVEQPCNPAKSIKQHLT